MKNVQYLRNPGVSIGCQGGESLDVLKNQLSLPVSWQFIMSILLDEAGRVTQKNHEPYKVVPHS